MTMPAGALTPGPPPPVAPPKPPPFRITATSGSELDELIAQRDMAKARAAEAKEIADTLDARVKSYLSRLLPRGATEIEVAAGEHRPGIRMSFRRQRRLDTDRLKTEQPAIYNAYLKWGKPFFEISKL
jgi:hypothetical protein